MIAERHDEMHDLELVIASVGWSVGFDLEADLQGGRTLEAKIANTEHSVAVRLPEARNDEIDALSSGDGFSCRARLGGWDDLFERLQFDCHE